MANIFSGLIKRWNSVRKILVIVSSVIILFLFTIYLFAQNRITGDTASHLLLAVSPILKIGAPYKNFWDIKPAMWPLTIFLWSSLFGFRILSIRIINLIVGALVVIFCKLIYKKVFPTPIFEIFFLFTLVVVFSPILNTFMLPTEMLGLLLSLGALLALIGFRRDFPKYFLSGFLFFAASQTKEPFTFTILAVFPIFIESLLRDGFLKLLKNVMYFLLGILTCFAGIYIYLASFGSIASYIEVIKYKQVFYPFKFEKFSENFIPGFSSAERTFTEFSMGFQS